MAKRHGREAPDEKWKYFWDLGGLSQSDAAES